MQVSASREENTEISVDFGEKLKLNVPDEERAPKQKQEQGEDAEEFSFACANLGQSPVSADDAFVNGQIRPIFPVFDQTLLYRSGEGEGKDDSEENQSLRPPLRKLFVEERSELEEEEPVGPFCEWSSGNKTVKEATPEPCKKSNSTGFSRLWRFRELLRSSSDGKDAFVFLNNNNNNNDNESDPREKSSKRPDKSSEKPTGTKTTPGRKTSKGEKVAKASGNKRVKAETVTSVYEKYYARNRVMREGDKRRSYAPYRQEVVGFFTNVNGLSRNVHPF